jgi:hypothetical protein
MATYAAGEPLPFRDAVALQSAQVTWGTPVTPATSLGIVRGNHIKRGSMQTFRSPGSANLQARKGGSAYTEWSLNWPAIQVGSKAMFVKGVRVSKTLPFFTLGMGYQDDTGTPAKSADIIADCKINQLSLNLDTSSEHSPLTGSMSGIGGAATTSTALVAAHFTTAPYMSYEAAFTSEAAAYPLRTFSLEVNHNLQRGHRIPGATPASNPRGHFALTEGDEVITGSISLYTRTGQNPHANTITELDGVMTFTNLDDASTLVITLTDMVLDNENWENAEGGIVWSADYECRTWSLA